MLIMKNITYNTMYAIYFLFKYQWKQVPAKTLLMLMLIMKNITYNTMYTVQELHIFHNHLELNCESFYLKVIYSHQ